jgi:HipA-like protein
MPSITEKIQKFLLPNDLKKSEGFHSERAIFLLLLDDKPVGELSFENEQWMFRYHKAFISKNNKGILADFPDLNKTYTSTELWPFFASRIPSTSRHSINSLIKNAGIDEADVTKLLAFFGKRTITNPFTLELA